MLLNVPKTTTRDGVVVAGNTEVDIGALGVHCTETDDIHMLMLQSTKGSRIPGILQDGVTTHLYTRFDMALSFVTDRRQDRFALDLIR